MRSLMWTSTAAKPGSVEGRRHLHLAVDALLAQDGDSRSRPFGEERRGDVLGGIKGQPDVQPGSAGVAGRCERLDWRSQDGRAALCIR